MAEKVEVLILDCNGHCLVVPSSDFMIQGNRAIPYIKPSHSYVIKGRETWDSVELRRPLTREEFDSLGDDCATADAIGAPYARLFVKDPQKLTMVQHLII
jgi:hypothetical protein